MLVRFGFLLLVISFVFLSNNILGQQQDGNDNEDDDSAVYIVTLKQPPIVHLFEEQELKQIRHQHKKSKFAPKLKSRNNSRKHHRKSKIPSIAQSHDSFLRKTLKGEKYIKLYSYHYLINGFALFVSSQQAEKLSMRREVANIVLDYSVRTATTYTPQFMGLPQGAWVKEGGYEIAGEGIVIGFIDTGIDPNHPSFNDNDSKRSYPIPKHFSGVCEVTPDFPSGSCNKKLIGARHFAQSAVTRGIFNSSEDYTSPFDGDGHGTHTASVAAGNHGVPVIVSNHNFGYASGIAPRAFISVYKALYKSFGGFAADVVAAIDQAAQDGVDILSLSITPNRKPPGVATFFNPIDMALLSAVKAGIFVVQAAGNTGPAPKSMSSFSPWIFTVGASSHDRVYSNSLILGNNVTIQGIGFAIPTDDGKMYKMISAFHALNKSTSVDKDMYVGECQDYENYDQDLVLGNLLICSYSARFVLGLSTIKQALDVAKKLSAIGVVFYIDPYVLGFEINPTPMDMPGIIIPSVEDSKTLLKYYNSSLQRDGTTKEIVSFGAVASIEGGLNANFSNRAPKVMYYSARGPDPEDNSFNDADILKPNLVAPGNSIWGAWSSVSTDSTEFEGEKFAMMSGTSMAAPHVAGVAALIKQTFPQFTPSQIASALSTTALLNDNKGGPIMAQQSYSNPDQSLYTATPFDMGSGFVNATAALDPGLVFDTSFEDYMSFLCGINGSDPVVFNYTGFRCSANNTTISGFDLNLPSITVSTLSGTQIFQRSMRNIAGNETYNVGWSPPYGVSMKVSPTQFSIAMGETQVLSVTLTATKNSSSSSFGRIGLFGNTGHIVNIPITVIAKIASS
ncbi:Peptidase S8/S53 domain superfamily [Arabidopsis suecica]|uniref:Peptidase S8/S53 domain superfamily n=1 Tax=Arabidopsis suecica TaxID=45249 RepID=A0A8T1XVB9_ARASU|nr:Peptidase S8/S53 domain superfamily [Arabidopsis suecica]